MLEIDAKNYHAWSYRQWVVATFELWDEELPDVERLIDEDVRNNSAWNQRFYVFSKGPMGLEGEALEREIRWVNQKDPVVEVEWDRKMRWEEGAQNECPLSD